MKQHDRDKIIPFYTDISSTGVNPISTFAFVDLTPIPQSVGQGGRLGDNVLIHSIDVNAILFYSFSGSAFLQDYFDSIRVGIVKWIPDSALLAVSAASIFQNLSFPTLTSYNFEQKASYKFIDDRYFYVKGFADSAATASVPTSDSVLHWKTKYIINKPVRFNLATQGGLGKYYLFYGSDSSSAPHPGMEYYIRVEYSVLT